MYGIRDLYIMLLVYFVVNFLALDKPIIWKLSMLSENFWCVKILWSWERHYVAILEHLEHLTPDAPDG